MRRPALERFAEVILQFDRPVSEREFFSDEHAYQNDPAALAQIERLWRAFDTERWGRQDWRPQRLHISY